jgi:hypothetical protein
MRSRTALVSYATNWQGSGPIYRPLPGTCGALGWRPRAQRNVQPKPRASALGQILTKPFQTFVGKEDVARRQSEHRGEAALRRSHCARPRLYPWRRSRSPIDTMSPLELLLSATHTAMARQAEGVAMARACSNRCRDDNGNSCCRPYSVGFSPTHETQIRTTHRSGGERRDLPMGAGESRAGDGRSSCHRVYCRLRR